MPRRQLPVPRAVVRRLPFARTVPRIQTIAALAGFIRDRLVEVGDVLAPRRHRDTPSDVEVETATVIVAAAAPFAPTSFARARLLRQMHASGLLDDRESEQVEHLFGVAQ